MVPGDNGAADRCAGCSGLSSLDRLNRSEPVQTGRFHLGLVFSRRRRVKFGPGSRPPRALIGRDLDGALLFGLPLVERPVRLFQFAQAPTRVLRPQRKRSRLGAERSHTLTHSQTCSFCTESPLTVPTNNSVVTPQPFMVIQHVHVCCTEAITGVF